MLHSSTTFKCNNMLNDISGPFKILMKTFVWKNEFFSINYFQHIKSNREKQSLKALRFYN